MLPTVRHFALPFGLLLLGACADAERIDPPTAGGADHSVSFVGYAYDGATGTRLLAFGIDVLADDTTLNGSVAPDGRYSVGTLSAWDDFTVAISAEGYRAFLSHNARIGLPAEFAQSDDIDIGSHQTLHVDAYLFPAALEAPAVNFTITSAVPGASPAGSIRLRAVSASLLADQAADLPGGVPGQLWSNDEDLQAGVISSEFSGGMFGLMAGELIYGVTYKVDIYDVAGFQPFTGMYTAGVETNKTFTLAEALAEPLVVTSSLPVTCQPPASANATSGAVVTLTFNHPVEFGSLMYPGGPQEALDDFISIVSPDDNLDTIINTLFQDNSDSVQERAVSASVAGNTLTISWNPSLGLEIKDGLDPITQVSYAGLANVQLQRVGSPSSAKTLSTLLGTSSITCN
jgi:hypothetical protein